MFSKQTTKTTSPISAFGLCWSYGTLLVLLAIAPLRAVKLSGKPLVFVCIYATVGVGLFDPHRFTARLRSVTPRFAAIGAYTAAYLRIDDVHVSGHTSLAAGLLTGVVVLSSDSRRCGCRHLPRDRHHSFAFSVEEILARWEALPTE